ncbi:hypothetical protein A9Q83_01330 [Alphaproteobacteria bacterium 46_93_T64]|nr:hypothetical protein A9Q83_01330 [Alphaproteobacteria bacterium 46_93_T64]
MNFMTSEPGNDPIVVEGYFPASPERVFNAWTDPDIIIKWFGTAPNSLHSAKIDLHLGGVWEFIKSKDDAKTIGFEGQYQEIKPGEQLIYSWCHVITHADGERDASPYSRVEVNFKAKGKGTYVQLIHSAVRSEDARLGIGGGWNASFGSLLDVFAN